MINLHERDRAGIELATPGSAVRHESVARHVTDCATRSGMMQAMSPKLDTKLDILDLYYLEHGYYVTVRMPDFKLNRGLKANNITSVGQA